MKLWALAHGECSHPRRRSVTTLLHTLPPKNRSPAPEGQAEITGQHGLRRPHAPLDFRSKNVLQQSVSLSRSDAGRPRASAAARSPGPACGAPPSPARWMAIPLCCVEGMGWREQQSCCHSASEAAQQMPAGEPVAKGRDGAAGGRQRHQRSAGLPSCCGSPQQRSAALDRGSATEKGRPGSTLREPTRSIGRPGLGEIAGQIGLACPDGPAGETLSMGVRLKNKTDHRGTAWPLQGGCQCGSGRPSQQRSGDHRRLYRSVEKGLGAPRAADHAAQIESSQNQNQCRSLKGLASRRSPSQHQPERPTGHWSQSLRRCQASTRQTSRTSLLANKVRVPLRSGPGSLRDWALSHQLGSLPAFASMGPASDHPMRQSSQWDPRIFSGPEPNRSDGYQALLREGSNQQLGWCQIKLEGTKSEPI